MKIQRCRLRLKINILKDKPGLFSRIGIIIQDFKIDRACGNITSNIIPLAVLHKVYGVCPCQNLHFKLFNTFYGTQTQFLHPKIIVACRPYIPLHVHLGPFSLFISLLSLIGQVNNKQNCFFQSFYFVLMDQDQLVLFKNERYFCTCAKNSSERHVFRSKLKKLKILYFIYKFLNLDCLTYLINQPEKP